MKSCVWFPFLPIRKSSSNIHEELSCDFSGQKNARLVKKCLYDVKIAHRGEWKIRKEHIRRHKGGTKPLIYEKKVKWEEASS